MASAPRGAATQRLYQLLDERGSIAWHEALELTRGLIPPGLAVRKRRRRLAIQRKGLKRTRQHKPRTFEQEVRAGQRLIFDLRVHSLVQGGRLETYYQDGVHMIRRKVRP